MASGGAGVMTGVKAGVAGQCALCSGRVNELTSIPPVKNGSPIAISYLI